MIIAKDLTEKKEAEKLDRLLREAIEIDKLKTEFFANLSHELRTPLNILLGTTQLLKVLPISYEDSKSRSRKKSLENYTHIMEQNCFRLLRLINNLIDVTKIDAGFFEIKLGNHDIVKLVEDVSMSIASYMEDRQITLEFDTEVEERIIACDPDAIERIMLNLLSNATKFTSPEGQVFVSIYDSPEEVTISVRDTGVGISEEKQKIIFNRFVQDNKTLCRNHEGSGIGLSLVKSLVEMHGGSIFLTSQLGEGTEVVINLPVRTVKIDRKDTMASQEERLIERISIEFSDIYPIG